MKRLLDDYLFTFIFTIALNKEIKAKYKSEEFVLLVIKSFIWCLLCIVKPFEVADDVFNVFCKIV